MSNSTDRLKWKGFQKIVAELHKMIERPEYTTISKETEGDETTMFRSKFSGWDDIVPVDYTMTADTVQRRGTDIKVTFLFSFKQRCFINCCWGEE